jgi:hypothetical protein
LTFYPGSKQKVKTFTDPAKNQAPAGDDREYDLGRGRVLNVDDVPHTFYTVGTLAEALNRKSGTIRKWETDGIIPIATFILPSDDKRGQRRLYTKELGLRDIASQEGILYPTAGGRWKDVQTTQFKAKALELFKQLEGK